MDSSPTDSGVREIVVALGRLTADLEAVQAALAEVSVAVRAVEAQLSSTGDRRGIHERLRLVEQRVDAAGGWAAEVAKAATGVVVGALLLAAALAATGAL